MLDPLTALSLAGTICQFVDFSCKILSTTRHVYHSFDGDLTVNTELGFVANEIKDLSAKLDRPIPSTGSLSPDEQKLKDLCVACNNVAAELIEKLNGLKVRGEHRVWQSFRVAVQSAWSRQELNEPMKRLTMFKEAIESRIVLGLGNQIDQLSLQSSNRFNHLDRQTQDIVVALTNSQRAVTADLQQQVIALSQMLNRTEMVVTNQNNETRRVIIDAIQSAINPSIPKEFYHARIPVSLNKMKLRERELNEDIKAKILQALAFPSMNDRQNEVVEAYRTTFEWVFQDPNAHDKPWDNFATWLRSGSGVYWINGKAGSGKSTLMRYIYNHAATHKELSAWAAASGLPLSIGSFFFWNSGTKMQRSQAGLLRSLLFSALSERPELIPTIFPRLWAEYYMRGIRKFKEQDNQDEDQGDSSTGIRPGDANALTLGKLLQAFDILLTQPNRTTKLCLFVDGLDEYDGDNGDEGNYEDLAQLFTRISTFSNVKVCVSSRPLVVLQDTFRDFPTLKLQDLTFKDIEYYTQDNLQRHRRFRELVVQEPQRIPTLVKEIVVAADGVFLWVKLVVRSLLAGLSNRDSIAILQRRLMALPKDLFDLYSHMLYSRVDDFYMIKASEIFQMLKASREWGDIRGPFDGEPEPLTALTLSLADDEDINLALTAKIEPLTAAHVISRCQTMEMQLLNWSAGLLEVQGTSTDDFGESRENIATVKGKVQYMHRTVRDFIEQPATWQEILKRTAHTGFNPNQSLLKSCVLHLKFISPNNRSIDLLHSRTLAAAMTYAYKYEVETGNPNTALLNELDKVMTYHTADIVEFKGHGHWACFFSRNPAAFQDDFLSLAVRYGLCAYVSQALGHGDKVLKSKAGRPYLNYTVDRGLCEGRYPLSAQMIRLLLSHGARPNKGFMATTSWERVLASAEWESMQTSSSQNSAIWIEILDILVDAGANVNAISPAGTTPALEVVKWHEKKISDHGPSLEQKMREMGASSNISLLGKLSYWQKKKRRGKLGLW